MLQLDQIRDELLSLPRPQRDELAQALVASLEMDPEVESAWEEEIRRRVRDIDNGITELIPGDEVFREVDDLLRG